MGKPFPACCHASSHISHACAAARGKADSPPLPPALARVSPPRAPQPVSGSLGSLPLPQATLDAAVNKLMASPENREKLRLPAGVKDIEVENGQLVIEYE
jgi:hypothetical protein